MKELGLILLPDALGSTADWKYLVVIGQARAAGESELISVCSELANLIGQRVDGLATFTHIEGPASSISRVAEELGKSKTVHSACHGIPNPTA